MRCRWDFIYFVAAGVSSFVSLRQVRSWSRYRMGVCWFVAASVVVGSLPHVLHSFVPVQQALSLFRDRMHCLGSFGVIF